ncbi:ABC transporter ATP-binding protein [Actinacidiphila guanduensis]|uniref:Putative ABC transport system ATP-binding protein n=1 Tax=Actinacidiphila guanduensis TaxID=310781 RepID=A0A1H0PL04_9ACTN|nr:ATP-binding cassette domain-containing protein [Actinacidiphila guanduensis]SDP05345.1 putative ABC transport system ATP-binding protein [Actinacidiphila guanduensis]
METPPDIDLLRARGLCHSYRDSPALTGVSLEARAGEILALAGPRGAGKTTLLRCLSGQIVPDEGEVAFEGTALATLPESARERLRRDRFGWIGADAQLLPELNAWENAALPLLLRGERAKAARKAAQEWLDRLDIGEAARRRPGVLPPAAQQRVAVARALVAEPAVVFADEPTATLHCGDRAQVLRTLTSAARTHGITVLLATSDPETARFADRTVALVDGRHGALSPARSLDPTQPWPASV